MRKILALAFALWLSACQTVPQKPEVARLQPFEIPGPAFRPEEAPAAWKKFVYDFQVATPDGRLANLVKQSPLARKSDTRVILYAGSTGRSDRDHSVQGNIGLWLDPVIGRERAQVFVDVAWPLADGGLPDDLSNAKITSARLTCQEWAQGLAIDKASPQQYERLRSALAGNFGGNRDVRAEFLTEPYRIGDTWILPVLVRLKGRDFRESCL